MGHLIYFKGRNESSFYNLNLLFQDDKTYLMDNHLAASWCWAKHIDTTKQYNFFHIDAHYDFLSSQIETWIEELERKGVDLSKISIDELTNLKFSSSYKIFRCDNYLPVFIKLYPNILQEMHFVTHKLGGSPNISNIKEHEMYELPNFLAGWINGNNKKWILNIDIDYFFWMEDNGMCFQLLTDKFIVAVANEIKKVWDNIDVITIALSPEQCCGWKDSERIARLFIKELPIKWFE